MMLRVLFLGLLVISCNGLTLGLISSIAESTRHIIDGIATHPIVQSVTRTGADILTGTVSALTSAPIALARAIPTNYDLPVLIGKNVGELTDRIVGDFTAGLSNEDASLSIEKLIVKYGHPVERHKVVTEDGYILTLHRIPANGSVVFLMHGLLGSADDYVVAGLESGLAYLLAKEGYDVWMGNARGNKHSRSHLDIEPSEAVFWDFSWHEIGYYDLPAMIDYSLDITKKKNLKYIGHSQGTTCFFVMGSERPEYGEKISLMVALSPVAFMENVKAPLVRFLAPGTPLINNMLKTLGVNEVFPDNGMMRILKKLLCGVGPLAEILCGNLLFLTTGFGFGQMNFSNLPVVFGHMPSGASGKQFAHYGQGVMSREFKLYDYGEEENFDMYDSSEPPNYALENIKTPVALFYSEADWLADPRDVDRLSKSLPNVVDIHRVQYEQFTHVDFIMAKDFRTLIYGRLRKLLTSF